MSCKPVHADKQKGQDQEQTKKHLFFRVNIGLIPFKNGKILRNLGQNFVMHSVIVNNGESWDLEVISSEIPELKVVLVDQALSADVQEIRAGHWHVVLNNRSYDVAVISEDPASKSRVLRINGQHYTVGIKDPLDKLLASMGLDAGASSKVNEVKAPMPGLVLEVRVSTGTLVSKGDALVVLEAMKMENILKSPTDGVVRKVAVEKGMAVEKNQVLVQFE